MNVKEWLSVFSSVVGHLFVCSFFFLFFLVVVLCCVVVGFGCWRDLIGSTRAR